MQRVLFPVMAGVLAVAAAVGFAITRATWTPCDAGYLTTICLEAMDSAAHVPILNAMWLTGMGITVLAAIIARTRASRILLTLAAVLVLVMNLPFEYVLWAAITGTGWDLPPGAGYGMATAALVAAAAVAVATRIDARTPVSRRDPLILALA